MFGIIYSSKDTASMTLGNAILRLIDNMNKQVRKKVVIHQVDIDPVYLDYIDKEVPPSVKYIIVFSKHVAKSGVPTITVHSPGNPSFDVYGGRPRSLPPANPCLIGELIRRLSTSVAASSLEYDVTMEVTHHGPTEVEKPITFIEIGPNMVNWRDKKAADIVAKVLIDVLTDFSNDCIKSLGIGGPHYAPIFTRRTIERGYNFGHIISKYVLNRFDREIIDLALARNGGVDKVVINWKGLKGGVRGEVYNHLIDLGLDVEKV